MNVDRKKQKYKSEDQLSPSALGLGNSGDCGHSGREIFETIAKTWVSLNACRVWGFNDFCDLFKYNFYVLFVLYLIAFAVSFSCS